MSIPKETKVLEKFNKIKVPRISSKNLREARQEISLVSLPNQIFVVKILDHKNENKLKNIRLSKISFFPGLYL